MTYTWRKITLHGLELALAALLAMAPRPAQAQTVSESQLITCDHADQRLTITGSSVLDSSCTYTQGLDITASDVVLDCQGARIFDAEGDGSRGITIVAPTDVALSNVVVRNCIVEGFVNNIRVTRSGFKELEEGEEYEQAFSDIILEDSQLLSSRGSGVFVDGYVTGVTLRNLEILGSGSVGVYLEAGSMENVVEDCYIADSGFAKVDPEGTPLEVPGGTVYYVDTGREGIAVDGSRYNLITNNEISGASAGGIFLYKNCGEYATQKPESWWVRRYGADGNVISGNNIHDVESGVWIGSRMAQNQQFMDCSDPAYISYPVVKIHLDYASLNEVVGNVFENVMYGVRIEDDFSMVQGNTFMCTDPSQLAVVLGTLFRTRALELPVTGTTITGNQAFRADSKSPYRQIHRAEDTSFSGNLLNGHAASLRIGPHPPMDLHLFVEDVWYEPSGAKMLFP